MLKDIPYSVLKQDRRAYEIMLLRDQHGSTFSFIAKKYEISTARAMEIYNKQKVKQLRLYINHITVMLGYENTSQIKKVFIDADECYQVRSYSCAYLEKKYKDILTVYRDGEPGMPTQFIKSMPPLKTKFSKQTIARVIEMRENEKASYAAIAKELHITQAKAKHMYEMFYRKQVIGFIEALQKKAVSIEEKLDIWDYYFSGTMSSKKRYDMLIKAVPEFSKS